MDCNTRREFLKTSAALGMVVASSTAARQAHAANEEIGIGLIGCGRRSEAYVEHLTGVRSISDPDQHHLAQAAKAFGIPEKGVVTDFRKILDDPMHYLFFVSHRTGRPQIFAEIRQTGELIQLTDRTDLNEWSIHPSHDGRHVYSGHTRDVAGFNAWHPMVNRDGTLMVTDTIGPR